MTERERPLRLVVFSPSIVADIDNPAATSTRALLGALSVGGDDVTHLERRGNPLLDRQLRVRGSAALRSLNARYPEIRVRQYDLPSGQQRNVWFGTEVSTADAVVALPGTPAAILTLIAAFETPHLVRVAPPGAVGDLTFPDTVSLICVERRGRLSSTGEAFAVAYDNVTAAMAAGIADRVGRVVVGDSELAGWRYLPEVAVAELYRSAGSVTVLDGDDRPETLARVLLPVAAGCDVVAVNRDGERRAIAARELKDERDAAFLAAGLAASIRRTLARKRREFAAALQGHA